MSNAKQHAEWLSLVEVSGPFLTLTVLNQSFQFGLDAHEADIYRSVKEAYQDWEDNHAPQIHMAWIRFLLMNVLGYPTESIGEAQAIPESAVANLEIQGERIRPDLAILDPDDPRKVKLPILIYPRTQKLDSPVAGSSWPASPHARMQLLLQNTGLQAGYVTNGAQWSLVHVRKGEPTGYATWQTILLTEEKVLLQAFKGILGVEATLGAPEGKSLFDLLDKSAQDQEEVTKELGRQVRQAVEVFINAVDRLDQDSGRNLLAGIEPKEVYNGALTVMMRLIFLLCAEERGLMDDRELYVRNYSVGALNDQLREIASGDEQVLEHRHDAWKRLLATFRLVHGGCNHENLNLPAYGGSLFDAEKYPYLEECQIDNRVTLHLLNALEFLEIKVQGGGRETRRLSFRALGVEQIGHVYEGLLDHTAVRAEEAVVGLTGKETEEDEIALSALEANQDQIAKFFEKEKIKVSGNPEKLLQQEPNVLNVSKLRVACGTDHQLYERALPFLNIIREDSLEHLQVYPSGSIYVTVGADRRSSGTHYTPVSLTEEVVQYALEPQVYIGPAEGLPRSKWKLKTAKEIVDLKVCDMAMGSGAFLVQTCRYLSERLVEAWGIAAEKAQRPIGFSPEGHFFTKWMSGDHQAKTPGTLIDSPFGNLAVADVTGELISSQPEERLAQARRIIADRCLYGVDINPMAVEMAKLSLWLTTMRREQPFTFLDHALRVGDSLMGVSSAQLQRYSMDESGQRADLLLPWVQAAIDDASKLRKQLSLIPSHDPASIIRKEVVFERANIALQRARVASDMLLNSAVANDSRPFDQGAVERLEKSLDMACPNDGDEYHNASSRVHMLGLAKGGVLPFHWQLEFSDIFDAGGFDAIIGNPPFLGGQKITGALGTNYREFLVQHIAKGCKGSADLCAYFFLRAQTLLKPCGTWGLLATNTIAQGDTREVGLDQIANTGCTLFRAFKSAKWPGVANLEIAKVWGYKGTWLGPCNLEGQAAPKISPFLDDGSASGKPYRLKANEGLSFQGSIVLGMGFVMSPEQAEELIVRTPKHKDVLFPYLNGEDLNSRPDQSPSRWVINFFDWPLGRVGQALSYSGQAVLDCVRTANPTRPETWFPTKRSTWRGASDEQRKKWLQLGIVPSDYSEPVAADFPECLEIVERLVKPERDKLANGDATARDRARRWWKYGRRSDALYTKIASLDRCIVRVIVTGTWAYAFSATDKVFMHKLCVVATDDIGAFATLQSSLHQCWAYTYSSTLGGLGNLNYSPSDCFETFPFPPNSQVASAAGICFEASRKDACNVLKAGFTDLAKMMHDQGCVDAAILDLRQRLVKMDYAVRDVYAWQDLDLAHDFYGEGRDSRFTISPLARQKILRRLLRLNHERYEEEVKAGLHDKGKHKATKARTKSVGPDDMSSPRKSLFDDQPTLGEMNHV